MGPAAVPYIILINTRAVLRLDERSLSLSDGLVLTVGMVLSCNDTLKLPRSASNIAARSE
jgi:hypothetical protein